MIARIFLFVCLLTLAFQALPLPPAQAQGFEIPSCTLPDGQRVIPVIKGGDLVLVNLNTGEVAKTLEAGISPALTSTILVRGWTPNCVNVLISLRGSVLVAWNVIEARRVGQVSNAAMAPATLVFAPDNEYIFARPYIGVLIWHLPTGNQFLVSRQGVQSLRVNRGGSPARGITWDLPRKQVLAVLDERPNGVSAINLTTGQIVAFYSAGERAEYISYQVQGDRLFVLTAEPGHERLTVYERNALGEAQGLQLNLTAAPAGLVRTEAYTELLYTPDGRYLVVSNRDLYLFDLANLGPAPHVPLARIEVPSQNYPRLRWVDGNTLEGYYYYGGGQEFSVWRWTLNPAEQVYRAQLFRSKCADFASPHPDLIAWACGQ